MDISGRSLSSPGQAQRAGAARLWHTPRRTRTADSPVWTPLPCGRLLSLLARAAVLGLGCTQPRPLGRVGVGVSPAHLIRPPVWRSPFVISRVRLYTPPCSTVAPIIHRTARDATSPLVQPLSRCDSLPG